LEPLRPKSRFSLESKGCSMEPTVILSVGLDPELLGTRNLVLETAGYTVVSAYSVREAVERFQQGDFNLILVCQSIPASEKVRFSQWIRTTGSRVPVVFVSGIFFKDEEFAGLRVDSEPGALLWGIREVLINAGLSAARPSTAQGEPGVSAIEGKKPPATSTGYEQQSEPARKRPVSITRRG